MAHKHLGNGVEIALTEDRFATDAVVQDRWQARRC